MSIDHLITFDNGNLCKITYGDVLSAIDDTGSDPFHMTISCQDEWDALVACVNVGIDSHLEAFSNAPTELNNGTCLITPHNLCILLRRLTETDFGNDSDLWGVAYGLQSSILAVLGFDDYGKYVGRKALGLD